MNFLKRIFGQKAPPVPAPAPIPVQPPAPRPLDRFDKMLVGLTIDGAQVLFVMLAADGTVNRLGDGSIGCTDRDMFIGRTQDPLFAEFMASVDTAIFAHQGSYDVPEKTGKLCQLRVLFGLKDSEACEGFEFRYGSDSQGAPREIANLVIKAVQMTNAWHAAQKKNTKAE